jgi:hypothetical protein
VEQQPGRTGVQPVGLQTEISRHRRGLLHGRLRAAAQQTRAPRLVPARRRPRHGSPWETASIAIKPTSTDHDQMNAPMTGTASWSFSARTAPGQVALNRCSSSLSAMIYIRREDVEHPRIRAIRRVSSRTREPGTNGPGGSFP